MADKFIVDFTEDTTPANGDYLVTVDVSDTTDAPTGTNKKVQLTNLPVSSATQTALGGKANTSHTHTTSNITDFDTGVSNNTNVAANTAARHTHSNAAVLNATTASFTTADETKLDGIATGATANTGDVVGPASSTDNAIARFDGTTGKIVQGSPVQIDDAGSITGVDSLASNTMLTDTINENTTDAGVTVDGVLIKDTSGADTTISRTSANSNSLVISTANSTLSYADSIMIRAASSTGASSSGGYVYIDVGTGTSSNGRVKITNGGSSGVNLSVDNITGSRTITFPDASTALVGNTTTQTLTNKRITQRDNNIVGSTSPQTINSDNYDQFTMTAISVAMTISNPSGTPTNGQKLLIRLKDNGTARALTWDANFRAVGVTLPTTTVASKTVYVGCIYNTADSKWDAVSVNQEA